MVKKKVLHRIPAVLKEKGKSGYWLAQETGITYNSINRYVNDKVEPSLSNLFRIADALGVLPSDLINDGSKKPGGAGNG
jgi:putative transcriptional regulator